MRPSLYLPQLRLYIDDEGDEKGDRITNLRELGAVKQLLLKTM